MGGGCHRGPRGGGGVVARGITVKLGGGGREQGLGALIYNNSNTNGAFFCTGPGLVRYGYSFIIASPGNRVLHSYKRVLVSRKCGILMLSLVGVRRDSYCGPFMCLGASGSIRELIAGLFGTAAPGGSAGDSPF